MINYTQFIVVNSVANDTIYTYLKRNEFSENYLKNLRKEFGFIKLNNKNVFITEKVKNGDILQLNSNPNKKTNILECDMPLDILYEDKYLLAVFKPSGIATMPTRTHYSNNLSGAILHYMKNIQDDFVVRIINRLDKDTAGIVIIAKDSLTSNILNKTKIEKTYYALLYGEVKEKTIVNENIKTIMDENNINERKRVISKDGKPATTIITPLKIFQKNNLISTPYTLCKINIEHGRTHQIRVHSAHISHPLVGDSLYGISNNHINHSALVCKEISFNHPIFKQTINISCKLPSDFEIFINL